MQALGEKLENQSQRKDEKLCGGQLKATSGNVASTFEAKYRSAAGPSGRGSRAHTRASSTTLAFSASRARTCRGETWGGALGLQERAAARLGSARACVTPREATACSGRPKASQARWSTGARYSSRAPPAPRARGGSNSFTAGARPRSTSFRYRWKLALSFGTFSPRSLVRVFHVLRAAQGQARARSAPHQRALEIPRRYFLPLRGFCGAPTSSSQQS